MSLHYLITIPSKHLYIYSISCNYSFQNEPLNNPSDIYIVHLHSNPKQ